MAVRLTSQFEENQRQPDAAPESVADRVSVPEQRIAVLSIELNRMIDEVSYLRLKFEKMEGDHR